MKTLSKLATFIALMTISLTAHSQSSLEGTYVAKYGLFGRHAIDLTLGKVALENGRGSITLSLTEYLEFGNCTGTYTVTSLSPGLINILTPEGMKCQGLLGKQYSWLSINLEVAADGRLSSGSSASGRITLRQLGDIFESKKVLVHRR